jgi:hypothetical protein
MLPLAAAAYGVFNDWSGIVWFAWLHGQNASIDENGWALHERRTSNLGSMISDGMMIDHMRTAGMIYRQGLVARSQKPVTIWTEAPFAARGYQDLMRGKDNVQPGWPDVHAIRRAYGPVPAGQTAAPCMTAPAVSPIISDTNEIVRDVTRRQFTVTAPRAEGFSGFIDDQAPAGLRHLRVSGADFATVIAVAADGQETGASAHLVISRTGLDATGKEIDGPAVSLSGMHSSEGLAWRFTVTRPRAEARRVLPVEVDANGGLTLPQGSWREGELSLQ